MRPKLENKADDIFSFRLNRADKEQLNSMLLKLSKQLNSEIKKNEYKVTRNEILVAALKIGLDQISILDMPQRLKKDA